VSTTRRIAIVAVLAASTAVAPAAQARTAIVDGHVIAAPSANGKRVSVPLLLTTRSERRLRLRRGIVRVTLPRRAAMSAPGAGGAAVAPAALRVGDRLRGRARLTRRSVERLRKRAIPKLALRRARIVARASSLGNDDLLRMIRQLDSRLTALSRRVDEMGSSTSAQLSGLRRDLDALSARTGLLESGLGSLGGSLDDLIERIDLLEGIVDPELLTALRADVDSLLGRVGSLEGITDGLTGSLGGLSGTVGGLQSSLGEIQGQLDPLLTNVDALTERMDDADAVLAQVPTILGQVGDVETALAALNGRVDASDALLASLGSTVDGLSATITSLTAVTDGLVETVTEQGVDVSALEVTIASLSSSLADVTSGLASLQGAVGALVTTTDDLTDSVDSLANEVTDLQGVVGVICALPLVDCTP
jgi:ABC-type transporter Mla subunit MlaD